MNLDILNKYNLKFYKQTSRNGKIKFKSTGGGLGEFLDDYTDPDSIREGIENVKYYSKGGGFDYSKNTVSSELYTAWIDNLSAKIYPSVGNTENLLQSIPIKDFEAILELWLHFISDNLLLSNH